MIEKAFVTGADKNVEWLLPWWYEKLREQTDYPLFLYDCGLSEKAHNWVLDQGDISLCTLEHKNGWFMKPAVLLDVQANKKVWLDVDCEVVGDINGLFNFIKPDKIAVAPDPIHSWGCKYNTGVVGIEGKPDIAKEWKSMCDNPSAQLYGDFSRGDQELLWVLLREKGESILSHIPKQYNWLRMYIEKHRKYHRDVRIIHWTGQRGKDIIRKSYKKQTSTLKVLLK